MKKYTLWIAGGLGALLLLLVPLYFKSTFVLHIYTLTFFYIGLTAAWNIMAYGGNLSLGHASFFAIGAYVGALLYVKLGISPWIGLTGAVAASFVGGMILSMPLIRLRGPFFTLATIAFTEVLRLIAIDWRDLTHGSAGLNIPFDLGWLNLTFKSGAPFYYIALALAVGSVWLSRWVRYSALGYHLRAAASDDQAAEALGVDFNLVQITALLISATLTAVLGLFYAFYSYVLEPATLFSFELFSLQPALNAIIGGMGTVWGPVIGAVFMTPLGEFLRFYLGTIQQGLNYVVYGIILIMTVRFFPGGILSLLTPLGVRFKRWIGDTGDNQ
ncbi:MAG: branched-chain amino acid ABC transporter permease [Proteobacteria bacterium]|nr:branched-chain amino acid ABC transporter permease [Pseudomonadota bacterium]MBU4381554.1 branched-chain amino acid ABC transporter permease [Pseudomonadota bacterium]MCG2766541.1 branched-chain amino acid ABC transporter permease [Desulfarculaceae bacterium]